MMPTAASCHGREFLVRFRKVPGRLTGSPRRGSSGYGSQAIMDAGGRATGNPYRLDESVAAVETGSRVGKVVAGNALDDNALEFYSI